MTQQYQITVKRKKEGVLMKAIIIIHSYHHKNTEKIAHAIANKLEAVVQDSQDVNVLNLQAYDLVGFGAGIDSGRHYAPLIKLAETLPMVNDKKAFIFSTSGVGGKKKMYRDHTALRDILVSKGYCIVDEFGCVGFNTNSFLKVIGGLNKNRPNAEDIRAATDFAERLIREMKSDGLSRQGH